MQQSYFNQFYSKTFVCFIFLLGIITNLTTPIWAQELKIDIGKNISLEHNSSIVLPIGVFKNKIYYWTTSNQMFDERTTITTVDSKTLEISDFATPTVSDKNTLVIKAVAGPEHLWLFTVCPDKERKTKIVKAYKLNQAGEVKKGGLPLLEIPSDRIADIFRGAFDRHTRESGPAVNYAHTYKSIGQIAAYNVVLSDDSSKIALVTVGHNDKKQTQVTIKVMEPDKLKTVWEKEINLPYDKSLCDIKDCFVGNNGAVYLGSAEKGEICI